MAIHIPDVCGNEFRFKRLNSYEEEEWGTLVLDDATKRSTWRTKYTPICQGNCVDNLVKVPQGEKCDLHQKH